MGGDHIMETIALRRERRAVQRVEEREGIREISWVHKGSVIQQVTDRLLRRDEALLSIGRWQKLERRPGFRTTWMVRDVWFLGVVVALWRISVAGHYLRIGASASIRALLGRELDA